MLSDLPSPSPPPPPHTRRRPIAWPSRRALSRMKQLPTELDPALPVVGSGATLNDALDTMLVSSAGATLVTGRGGVFEGVVDVETVMDAISAARASAAERSEDAPVGTNTGSFEAVAGAAAASAEVLGSMTHD